MNWREAGREMKPRSTSRKPGVVVIRLRKPRTGSIGLHVESVGGAIPDHQKCDDRPGTGNSCTLKKGHDGVHKGASMDGGGTPLYATVWWYEEDFWGDLGL